jgi:hypothetical protein
MPGDETGYMLRQLQLMPGDETGYMLRQLQLMPGDETGYMHHHDWLFCKEGKYFVHDYLVFNLTVGNS